jgi:hypothetical protein
MYCKVVLGIVIEILHKIETKKYFINNCENWDFKLFIKKIIKF